MIDARTVALLARAPTTSLDEAEDVIQQYAKVVASEAAAKALEEAYARTMAVLNAPLSENHHAQA
jgi:ABC-type Fe3+-hydroxamate transport system substrate-binding protein